MKKYFYKFLIKLVQLLDPEKAHFIALFYLKFNNFNRKCIQKDFKKLNTSFCNINIKNPIGLAAGFDKNGEAINGLLNLNMGFVEIGAVTPKPQYGNKKPRIFRLKKDYAIINRLGFNNLGMKIIKKNINRNFKDGIIGINVGANKNSKDKISDFIDVISCFSNDVNYFTINISSPNTFGLRKLQNKRNLNELLYRICSEKKLINIKKPILIKISPDLENDELEIIVESCQKYKIDGIVATNTSVHRNSNLKNNSSKENGGLSGKPLFYRSNLVLAKLYYLSNGKIPLIGVGGVFSGKDAYKKICIGATVVQLYTALSYEGPLLFNNILNELNSLVERDGFNNISEAVGSKNYEFLKDETDLSIFG